MRVREVIQSAVAALVAVTAVAGSAGATKLYVANDGLDSPSEGDCGGKHQPCRSIGKAIANAAAGDTIIVGPGRYGDLNGDGSFDPAAGEEAADTGPCRCMIHPDKPASGVRLVANVATGFSGVGFLVSGSRNTLIGDTAVGGAGTGFATVNHASDIVFDGDNASGNKLNGFFITEADRVTLTHNTAIANGLEGFDLDDGHAYVLTGNVARSNGETGFRSDTGGGDVLVGNVATANGLDGFGISFASLADVFRGNLSEGNAGDGFAIASGTGPHVIVGNSIIGNGGFGVVLAVGTTATINGLPIDASNNFWGAEGPGADPADNAGTLSCDGGAKVTVVRPAATKEFKVKPKIKL